MTLTPYRDSEVIKYYFSTDTVAKVKLNWSELANQQLLSPY